MKKTLSPGGILMMRKNFLVKVAVFISELRVISEFRMHSRDR